MIYIFRINYIYYRKYLLVGMKTKARTVLGVAEFHCFDPEIRRPHWDQGARARLVEVTSRMPSTARGPATHRRRNDGRPTSRIHDTPLNQAICETKRYLVRRGREDGSAGSVRVFTRSSQTRLSHPPAKSAAGAFRLRSSFEAACGRVTLRGLRDIVHFVYQSQAEHAPFRAFTVPHRAQEAHFAPIVIFVISDVAVLAQHWKCAEVNQNLTGRNRPLQRGSARRLIDQVSQPNRNGARRAWKRGPDCATHSPLGREPVPNAPCHDGCAAGRPPGPAPTRPGVPGHRLRGGEHGERSSGWARAEGSLQKQPAWRHCWLQAGYGYLRCEPSRAG